MLRVVFGTFGSSDRYMDRSVSTNVTGSGHTRISNALIFGKTSLSAFTKDPFMESGIG